MSLNVGGKAPLVYIVMPNKNGGLHLRYSLESLFASDYPNFRAVIVDNRSTDDSLRYVAENFPKAEMVVNETDRGFAGSVNRGVLYALSKGARYVAIYSNDIRVKPNWLLLSLKVFAERPDAGVIGYIEVPKANAELFTDSTGYIGSTRTAEALPGCLLLCSNEVFFRAGLMDEGYFMYGEDNDFFDRISAAGLTLLQTDIPVWHYGEGSAAKKRFFPAWMAYRNALRFSLKNRGLMGAARMAAALFYHGCLPHGEAPSDPSLKRLRRCNPFVNIALLSGSLAWNLLHLASTLMARRSTGREKAAATVRPLRVAVVNRTGGGISGGYLRYLEHMLPRLCCSEKVEKVFCALPASTGIGGLFRATEKLELHNCSPALPMWPYPGGELGRSLRDFRPDVVFVPTARRLAFDGVPQVTMIQNMAPLKQHGSYPLRESLRMLAQRLEARVAVSRASRIIAMSGFVRDFLTQEWGLPEGKVSTVYFGAPKISARAGKAPEVPGGLAGGFFFSAGSLEPYRGIEDLLYAASTLKKSGQDVKVLLAGGTRRIVASYAARLRAIARDEGIEGNIVWLGSLGPEEMNWCYANCAAFVMTSRVESLAVITLEAMVNGCVCISVDMPPLPEAFGDTAFYYGKEDSSGLAGMMAKVLALSPDERGNLAARSRAQAAKFSWDKTAAETIEIFRDVVVEAGLDRGNSDS